MTLVAFGDIAARPVDNEREVLANNSARTYQQFDGTKLTADDRVVNGMVAHSRVRFAFSRGTIHSIYIANNRGDVQTEVNTARLTVAVGLEGDRHAGTGVVTLIELEKIQRDPGGLRSTWRDRKP